MASTHQNLALSFALLSLCATADAEVWIVDRSGGPGSDFTSIQQAVAAASDGDLVLVLGGQTAAYQPFTIDGKGLSVIADSPDVTIDGEFLFSSEVTVQVRNTSPNQEVVVRGFTTNPGYRIEDCAGPVWFDRMRVEGETPCAAEGAPGAYVANSPQVTLTGCKLLGESPSGAFLTYAAADGLRVESSVVQLFSCEVRGGWGDNATPLVPGAGIAIESGTVTLSGCAVRGGDGDLDGTALIFCDGNHGPGGPGVDFLGGPATLRLFDSDVLGGFTDFDVLCPGLLGPPGPDFEGTGQVEVLDGVARHLSVNGPANAGEPLILELSGLEGELAAVLLSLTHQPVPLPAPAGLLLVGLSPGLVLSAGTVPADGVVTLSFTAPGLGPSAEGLVLYAQAVFVDPSPASWLGAGAAVVLLDL